MTLSRAPDPQRGKASGFTLLEVLVTVVILSIGLIAVLRAYATYVQALEQSGDVLISQLLIDEALDDIRFGIVSRQGLRPFVAETRRNQAGITYLVETRVAPAQRADHDSFFDVTVSVRRVNGGDLHKLQTLIRQPGQGTRGQL